MASRLKRVWREAFDTPPPGSVWEWAERNIVLGNDSAIPGPYRSEVTPFVREVMDVFSDDSVNDIILMWARQCAKSQTFMILLSWAICNSPGPMLWVMSALDEAKTFSKSRLLPMLRAIEALRAKMPTDRERDNILEQHFDSMSLYLAGSNSPSKLMSRSIRYVIMDEIGAYSDPTAKHTSPVDTAVKTTSSFWNSRRLYSSTPTIENDEIHRLYKSGDQRMFYVKCPHCGHMQNLRWGETESPGGMKWDENEITRPGGTEWNFDEVKKTVRYQCEGCLKAIMPDQGTRRKLLESGEWRKNNPNAPSNRVSFHLNQLYPIWNRWENLVEEFLRACMVRDDGDIEPLKSFIQYVLGEPWKEKGQKAEESDVTNRCGEYNMGQPWPHSDESTLLVAVADVQMDHIWVVIRAHRKGFGSGMIWCGRLPEMDDLREKQTELGINNRAVWLDARYRKEDVYEKCLAYGWRPIIGEDDKEFSHATEDSSGQRTIIKRGWRKVRVDPYAGKSGKGRYTLERYSWSNPTYKDKLYLKLMKGQGVIWEIPRDAPREYYRQVQAEERQSHRNTQGIVTWKWHQMNKNNHYGDCECMHAAIADMSGFSRGTITEAE